MSAAGLAGALAFSGLVVLASTAPSAAQIHPMTSGSMWFYSPNHHSPFNQFSAPAPSPAAPLLRPCAQHVKPIRALKRPC